MKIRQKSVISRTILVLIISSLVISIASALLLQDVKFTGNVATFPVELKALLSDEFKKDENEKFLKSFEIFWASDTIPSEQKEDIIANANLILPILPDNKVFIINYIQLVNLVFHNEYALTNYPEWNKFFKGLLNNPNTNYGELIETVNFTHNLISSSTLTKNLSFAWKVGEKNKYLFSDENGKFSINFNNITLICVSKDDSIYIENTSGTYFVDENKWTGKNGKVTWSRSGYSSDEIYATLDKYNINLNLNSYDAENVSFVNKDYFDKPIKGRLEERLVKDYKVETIDYPQFYSYEKWFKIKELFRNVDYEGGFTMKGSKLIGVGTDKSLAKITIRRNGKVFLTAKGKIMLFERTILNADKASICFKFDEDSLYHNGLYFSFNSINRKVIITPTDKITTQSPFYSSYHKLSIWTNQLSWVIDDDKIYFEAATGTSIGNATLESENFFNTELFDNVMGISKEHPLLQVWNYSVKNKTKVFKAADLASFLRMPVEEVRIEMMRFAKEGYILYDFETDEVKIMNKLRHSFYSRFGKSDYDVIRFSSTSKGSMANAILDINSMDLKINGVNSISVSNSQSVYIQPSNNELTMKKNRDFDFGGIVQSGLFRFYGKQFHFNYNKFKIEITDADSLSLDYQTNYHDNYGKRILQSVASTFNKISGEIFIDDPTNKSGLVPNPDYPIFTSTKNSYVYYDDPSIFNGIYKRDSIYFEIYKFTYKNMDNFERSDLNFKGIFYSKNILAPIEDSLVLRPDNSLGFVKATPPEGVAVYKGKGIAHDRIDLSNKGLFVRGGLEYLSSTTKADTLYLFPDSMVTQSNSFKIEKRISGIEYPSVSGNKHNIRWLPGKGEFSVSKGESPFKMYDTLARFNGSLMLTPLGLTGKGSINIPNAKMYAETFNFNANNFNSPKSNLTIYAPASENEALVTKKVKPNVDFTTQKAEFTRIDSSIFAELKELRYETYFDRVKWDMANNNLAFKTPMQLEDVKEDFSVSRMYDKDSTKLGSLFYSVKNDEDSLYFFSPNAVYNTQTTLLNADSVKHITVADAYIVPEHRKLSVDSKDRLHRFSKAIIQANYQTAYHKIFNADIRVSSRKYYKGSGDYNYVDERDSVQTIHFKEVKVQDSLTTYATGTVTVPDSFKLSPHFRFIGDITLYAPDKNLDFKGGAMPIYFCPNSVGQWVNFESKIDPKNVLIPVPEKPKNLKLYPLISGSIISEDSIKLYGGFLRSRKNYDDIPWIHAYGYMNFNNNNRRFTIAPLYKLNNPDTSGNSVSIQKDYCWVFGDGLVDFPVDLGQVKIRSYGNSIHKLKENDASIQTVTQINFFFNQKSLEAMANDINGALALDKVPIDRKLFKKALFAFIDSSKIKTALSQLQLFGAFSEIPKGYESTITFNDLRLVWNPTTKSFVSKGKLGIGTVGNIQVNKYVDGFVEFYKGRSSDNMTIYIHLGDTKYYVFTYTRSAMQVSSDNLEFVTPIKQQRTRDKKLKTKLREPSYRYLIGTKRNLNAAQTRYKELKYGIKAEPEQNNTDEPDTKDEKN